MPKKDGNNVVLHYQVNIATGLLHHQDIFNTIFDRKDEGGVYKRLTPVGQKR